jgi:two-component system response regulator EvgA
LDIDLPVDLESTERMEPTTPSTNPPQRWRAVICEDHPATRIGLQAACTRIGCEVVAETASGVEAIDLVERYQPDLLLLDQYLPDGFDGRMVQQEIRRRGLPTKIFVFTSYCDSASFFDWIDQPDGPDGVLEKTTSIYELHAGLTQVLTSDEKFIPASVRNKEHGDHDNPLHKLAPHEMRVLRDVAQGFRLIDIAPRQGLAPSTVRTYMNNIYHKLGLKSHTLNAAGAAYNDWIRSVNPKPEHGRNREQ